MSVLVTLGSIVGYALGALITYRLVLTAAMEDVLTCNDRGRCGHGHRDKPHVWDAWSEGYQFLSVFGTAFWPMALLTISLWRIVFPHGRENIKTRSQKVKEREAKVEEREAKALTREASLGESAEIIRRLSTEYGFPIPEGLK